MSLKNTIINMGRGTKKLWTEYHFLVPPKVFKKKLKSLKRIIFGERVFNDPFDKKQYNNWLNDNKRETVRSELKYRPLISVLVPVYNVDAKYLRACIDSILGQSYDNFEICMVDDASTKKETIDVLKEYEKNEKIKIKYRKTNGQISRATNDALEMAKGTFVALVDNDDVLEKDALYEVVKVLNEDKTLDLIYSDEDKIDVDGERRDPHFKPDFSPDTLLSLNYICHLTVIRTSVVREVGGWTVGVEGAQDYDLFLKVTEKTQRVCHIPKILYHWRMLPNSTALKLSNKDYAQDNGKKAIEMALKRRGIDARVEKDLKSTYYRVFYNLRKEPKVSILIPMRDQAEVTRVCLESIYKKTRYKNFEIIIINNGSIEKESFLLFEEFKKKHENFRVIDEDIEFNYSKLNNLAAKKAKGEYLVLLNNDTEIITEDWLSIMVGYGVQPHVGAVGAKLIYPDETLQHAGVILGLGGVASHAYIGASREDVGMYGRLKVPYDYAAVTAACLLVSKKKFEEVNGLEEDLKVAYNDIDFCLKLLKKGYFNVFLPMVEIYHFESKSRGSDLDPDKIERFNSEQKYMWKKWQETLDDDRFYNPNFTKKAWFLLDKK